MPLKLKSASKDKKAPRAPSNVDGFCQPPELPCVVGSVAPPAYHLALAAARALSAVRHGDAQHGRRRATIRGGPAGVGTAGPWPRCDEPARLFRVGWSDSPAQ